MAQVTLVKGDATKVVTTTRGFVDDVYNHGWVPQTGSVESNYAILLGVSVSTTGDHSRIVYEGTLDREMAERIADPDSSTNAALVVAGNIGVTDHGALLGRGDDDHLQYFNAARGDARYARTTDIRFSDARTPLAHTHTASQISDATPIGLAVVRAVAGFDARAAIGAGTSNVELATTGQAQTGTDDTRAVTPVGLKAVLSTFNLTSGGGGGGTTSFAFDGGTPSTTYTASDNFDGGTP